VPARNTDFAHLRDGLVRAVQGRLKTLTKAGQLTEEEAEVRMVSDLLARLGFKRF
jgi:hypothetical protein